MIVFSYQLDGVTHRNVTHKRIGHSRRQIVCATYPGNQTNPPEPPPLLRLVTPAARRSRGGGGAIESVASMSVYADLHSHTRASDGLLAPAALVALAARCSIPVLAVTD